MPTEPAERIESVLEAELGGSVGVVFADFDWEPLAAASIGQAYRARLHTGEAVVVKVQRPDIERIIERDLAALAHLAELAERRTPLGRSVRSGEILGQFAQSLRDELDYLGEADAMADMAVVLAATAPGSGFPGCTPSCAPGVCWSRSASRASRRPTPTSWRPPTSTAAPSPTACCDRPSTRCCSIGFFHADPHPGNVFVLADGTLGLIDFGAVGRLDPIQRAAVVDMMAGLVRQDVSLLRDGIERVADMGGAVSSERLERAIARLHGARTCDPAARSTPGVLAGARADADRVRYPPARRPRPAVPSAGDPRRHARGALARSLDRGAAAWSWRRRRPSRRSSIPRSCSARSWPPRCRASGDCPIGSTGSMTLAARGDLRLRTVVDEDGGRMLRTLVNRALLAATGAAFLVASAVLLVATDDGPAVAGSTGLFEILGYGGLFVGSVLLLRVVAAVARDGHDLTVGAGGVRAARAPARCPAPARWTRAAAGRSRATSGCGASTRR